MKLLHESDPSFQARNNFCNIEEFFFVSFQYPQIQFYGGRKTDRVGLHCVLLTWLYDNFEEIKIMLML